MDKMVLTARILLMILEGIAGRRLEVDPSEARAANASKLWEEVARKCK
jgi:hypothetical protein